MKVVVIIMIILTTAAPSAADLSFYDEGTAAFYQDPDGMKNVVEVRCSWGQCFNLSDYIDGVALNDCSLLGKVVWLQRDDGPIIGPFLNVDCARKEHFQSREERGIALDIGYLLAVEIWEADTYVPNVRIYLEKPRLQPHQYHKLERFK